MRPIVAALLIPALAACGGPPPPPAPTGPQRWSELAPATPEAPPKVAAARRFQIPHASALPDVATLEADLSKQGLIVDVGDEGEGRVIESQGVRCTVLPAPRLDDGVLPSPRVEPEYARYGLTMAEAEQLAASTATAEISCRPSTSPMLSAQVAIQVTDAVRRLVNGLVRDPQLGAFLAPADWTALRAERHFKVGAHVQVEATGDGALRALRTRGLTSFGRAELALYPVAAADAETTAARLLVLADSLLQEDPPAAGAASSLGPAKFIYLTPATYDAHAPAGPRPKSVEDTLVLADPKGKPGEQSAVDGLVHRLNAQ